MATEGRRLDPSPPSLGETQGRILHLIKRQGPQAIPDLARMLELSVETVRAHLRRLSGEGLLQGVGTRGEGPGRPVQLFGLTERAEAFFPDRRGEMLLSLVRFLEAGGGATLVRRFFQEVSEVRRKDALPRVEGLKGRARLEEVAAILTEDGFMAEVETPSGSPPRLRLCHCPIKPLIGLTREPCRAEIELVRELLGSDLARVSYIPSGDTTCSYDVN